MSLSRCEFDANRCLQCRNARCHQACPVHTEIPAMIRLFRQGNISEAGKMLYGNNPFSIVCSYVCNHEAQCVGHCILGIKSTPVAVNKIEKEIGHSFFSSLASVYCSPLKTEKKVAIIGGGPAGISAALFLRQVGISSTIFEKQETVGGVLSYGIPPFRLPEEIVSRYTAVLDDCEIDVRCGINVEQAMFTKITKEYDATILTLGVWQQKKLNIPGESLSISGVDYLINPSLYACKGNVLVLGAGNSAIDVARTAKRNGAAKVDIYARTNRIRASQQEIAEALEDGVIVNQGMAPLEITAHKVVFEKKKYNDNNEEDVTVIPKKVSVAYDQVIVSINRTCDFAFSGIAEDGWGNIAIDERGETSMDNVFAAGDNVTGAKTVVDAVASVKKIIETLRSRWIMPDC